MSRIEIVFLGTTAGIPTRKRSHPALHLTYTSDREFCYLFDCGEGTQRQMLIAGLNFMKINHIFITHWHADHYLGLPGLVETMGFEGRNTPLTICSTEPDRTRVLLNLGYSPPSFNIIYKAVPTGEHGITSLLETDYFTIVSTPVNHTVPSVAYALVEKDKVRIDKEKLKKLGLPDKSELYGELKRKGKVFFNSKQVKLEEVYSVEKGKKVVYSGDTRICDSLIEISQNADLLIQDCTYFDSQDFEDYGHASVGEVMKFLDKVKVARVILTHISRRYKDLRSLRKMVKNHPNLEIAKDFMRVVV
ncbi:ribonuclease Z [Candidatus Aerophobetes bacterium]|nr:ribonuclease Z [Candidatus Aerophobetes bacterium]